MPRLDSLIPLHQAKRRLAPHSEHLVQLNGESFNAVSGLSPTSADRILHPDKEIDPPRKRNLQANMYDNTALDSSILPHTTSGRSKALLALPQKLRAARSAAVSTSLPSLSGVDNDLESLRPGSRNTVIKERRAAIEQRARAPATAVSADRLRTVKAVNSPPCAGSESRQIPAPIMPCRMQLDSRKDSRPKCCPPCTFGTEYSIPHIVEKHR